MDKERQCKEEGCVGTINANDFVILHSGGCATSSLAFYCCACGRLHWWNEAEPISNKFGQKLFYESGKIVLKEDKKPILALCGA